MKGLLQKAYLLLVGTIAILPASSFNQVKVLILLLFLVIAALWVGSVGKVSLGAVLFGLSFVALLLLSLLTAAVTGSWETAVTLRAAASYGAVFAVSYATYLVYKWRVVGFQTFFVWLLVCHTLYLIGKVAVLALPVVGAVNAGSFLSAIRGVIPSVVIQRFSVDYVLGRLSLGNDIVTPFLCAFVVINRRLGVRLHPILAGGFVGLAATSVFLTFTRYIWAVFALSMVMAVMLFGRGRIIILLTLAGILFSVPVLRNPSVREAVVATARVRAADIGSLDIKREQAKRLLTGVEPDLILGMGSGAYLRDFVRDERLPFQYEVQWLGLLLQFGIVGLVVLATYLVAPALNFIRVQRGWRLNRIGLFGLLLYLLWLGSGFTNPYLSILAASLVYSLFIVVGSHLQEYPTLPSSSVAGQESPPHSA